MQVIARRAFSSLSQTPVRRKTIRLIAGRRYPSPSRYFRSSAISNRRSDDVPDSTERPLHDDTNELPIPGPTTASEQGKGPEIVEALENNSDALVERVQRGVPRSSAAGSAGRRATRFRKAKEAELPPFLLPQGFLTRNVKLTEELSSNEAILNIYETPVCEVAKTDVKTDDGSKAPETVPGNPALEPPSSPLRYQLHSSIWEEILATVRSGISLPAATCAETFPAIKSHMLLQCPKDGSVYYLDAVVEKVAQTVGADLTIIDAQDIAEIAGDYMAEKPEMTPYTIRSLGYEAHNITARQDAHEMEEDMDEDDEFEEDEGEDESPSPSQRRGVGSIGNIAANMNAVPIGNFPRNLSELIKSGKIIYGGIATVNDRMGGSSRERRFPGSSTDYIEEMKLNAFVESLITSAASKRGSPTATQQVSAARPTTGAPTKSAHIEHVSTSKGDAQRPVILMLRDYKEVQATAHGSKVLQILHDAIRKGRKAGRPIMGIGTVSSADLMPSPSKRSVMFAQSEYEDGLARTIVVTPPRSLNHDSILAEDESHRNRAINLRHLQDMIRRRTPELARVARILSTPELRLDSSREFASGLHESVWSFDGIHRVAVTALGLMGADEELTPEMIEKALQILDASDAVKYVWATEERHGQREQKQVLGDMLDSPSPLSSKNLSDDKLKRIRKDCNAHEKKLLGGVINPESIKTTFADVRAPPETIEALKTLTSLSLIRPEAFSYGVLATDKIPGLLLYGPPGTGKTLLAKAVAKESSATMLEVSGSEVYDMYVGEGEKNVKAIFTLARKLSPCVVFIDEADAIFGSRGGHANRTSHRELINQFLREWDGMNDLSAFIMVATNRPFDLDDAVLRRLPRRLLVDLPVEKDREAILGIHLKNETVDSSVSMADLAQQTPFYSGSDLKNVSVASALACVREENEEAAQAKAAGISHQYPARRTLSKRHFDKAMEEISASISEDMSSLTAIRKFDEKYGDRKGRRKKRPGVGFGHAGEMGGKVETGRVRNEN